ncbi:MAG: succinyl-diaminopimelate desuccinylase [Pseudomonadota bacterium]
MSPTLELAKKLISRPSITPDDEGCQKIISERLARANFKIESLRFGEVDNLWARYGDQAPLLVFAGHTDVVPTGPLDKWQSPPFEPEIRGDLLFGRGACDMKSGLAAMIVAAEKFVRDQPDFKGSIAFLITSDEEGASIDGTKKVVAVLEQRREKIDYCIVGEASSEQLLGDQIRVGRRGSLHGKLIIHGKQSHIAYPELADNPIHNCFMALQALAKEKWDEGNEFFPPTSFQISNIHSGTGALNVIPGALEVRFNFRYSTAVTADELEARVTKILQQHKLKFDLQWDLSGLPFLTRQGKLVSASQQAIKAITSLDTRLTTGGGTSDGRFIAPTGAEVVEIGPCNASAHQVDEHVNVKDLERLAGIYLQVLETLF